MKNAFKAALLASAMTISMGAMAQAGSSNGPDPQRTTADGKNMAPDATPAGTGTKGSKDHSSMKSHDKAQRTSTYSSGSSSSTSPVMQTTPDGKNKTPDASPVTK